MLYIIGKWLGKCTWDRQMSVIAWLESRWEKWWLDSSHVFQKMTRLESQSMTRVRVIFTISLSSWWTNPIRLYTKKWAFYTSVINKICGNFLFCLSSCAMPHFKDQVSPPGIEVDLRLCFHWRVSRTQYIDTLSWFNVVFAYCDRGSGPHTSVEQIGDFCNRNPVQNFRWEIRSTCPNIWSNPVYIWKKDVIKHFTAVINAVWISISDAVECFWNPVRPGSGSELQNPVGSQSGNRIMFNTGSYCDHESFPDTSKVIEVFQI